MIKIGILGYGNLGRGVELAVRQCEDMELTAVYTRRDPESVGILTHDTKVYHIDELDKPQDIDVLVLCGGSAADLPAQTAKYARMYNLVDSFDNHSQIPEHFRAVDESAREGGTVAMISAGWDPGLFSLCRGFMEAVVPEGRSYTFWGRGVSQGHSDAVRRIKGVKDARQYTVPAEGVLESVRAGEKTDVPDSQKHTRQCFVVAEAGADLARIRNEIVTMPAYFADYDTTVEFISEDEMAENHSGMPHGGCVIRSGKTGWEENKAVCEFRLELDSNPEFTASVLLAYARAVHRMSREGQTGCKTIFDIPVSYISTMNSEELRRMIL